MGDQFGIAIGILNYAYAVHGFQLGVLNHVKTNPKGLRWLPVFNTSFQGTRWICRLKPGNAVSGQVLNGKP